MKEKLLKAMVSMRLKKAEMQSKTSVLASHKSGMSEFMTVLIVCLIAVIVGAALMMIMKTAFPELFNDIIDKIKSTFTL